MVGTVAVRARVKNQEPSQGPETVSEGWDRAKAGLEHGWKQGRSRAGSKAGTRQMQERSQLWVSALSSCCPSATAGLNSNPGNGTQSVR